MHPDKKGKTTLNYIEQIPSTCMPSSSESDMVVPLKAITRAQAQAIVEKGKRKIEEGIETEATPRENTKKSKETWKQRRARRAAKKKYKLKRNKQLSKKQSNKRRKNDKKICKITHLMRPQGQTRSYPLGQS